VNGGKLRLHVVYEHGEDREPFGSAYLRLLQPLSHPSIADDVDATFAADYDGRAVDAVIVDRLWRPDIDATKARGLIADVRSAGAQLIHALDDSFPDLIKERPEWATPERVEALELFLSAADGLLVTTDPLARRLRDRQPNVAVVPNALDERLLAPGRWRRSLRMRLPVSRGPVVVGYMGTYTHDDDLRMIAPALRAAHERFGDQVLFEFLGVVHSAETFQALAGLPLRVVHPEPEQSVYPAFVPWFCNTFKWDVALSPLRDTPFNRGKSDIKFLDYAALGAAGIYSRVPAYADTVEHRVTGWLVDEKGWDEAITTLVADAAMRRRTAKAASKYLYAERTLARTAKGWVEALRGLLNRRPSRREGTTAARQRPESSDGDDVAAPRGQAYGG